MNRPRPSVLSLFDPLSAATSDADKENLPSLVVLPDHHSHCPPVLPKKRLVDIGDTTLGDALTDVLTGEQDVPGANDAQPHLETPLPRTPLTELTLGEADATPLTRGKTHPQPSTSPRQSSLNPLAQDVGYDAVSGKDDVTLGNILVPQIVVSYNSVNNSPEKLPQRQSHDNNTTSLIASPEEQTAHPRLHLRAPSIAQDYNRFSLDLQASFQMYLQSEASFDLLNDKISLVEPMESQTTDDECFDFELDKDNLQDAISRVKRGRKSDAPPPSPMQDSSEPVSVHAETPDRESDNNDLESLTPVSLIATNTPSDDFNLSQCAPSSPLSDCSDKSSKRWSTSSGIPSPTSYRRLKEPFPTPAKALSSAIPQSKQRRFSTPVATPQRLPSVVPPPAIQALRIVKRTKVTSAKAESSSDANSRETERPPSSMAARPRPGDTPSDTRPLRTQLPSSAKTAPGTSTAGTGVGPRRMTVTTDSQVGMTVPKSGLVSATFGPKRIMIGNNGPNPPLSKPPSIPSRLKQPKRFETDTSNLPRPSGIAAATSTSRLPIPQSKLRQPVAGIGKGVLSRRIVSGD